MKGNRDRREGDDSTRKNSTPSSFGGQVWKVEGSTKRKKSTREQKMRALCKLYQTRTSEKVSPHLLVAC